MSFDQDQRRRVYPLRFTQYGGLVVRVRKPGWAAFERLTNAVLVLGDDLSGAGLAAVERMPAWRELFKAFADSLVAWDLTDRGRPVPATRKGVLAQDFHFLIALARTWYIVVVQNDDAAELATARKNGNVDLPQNDPQPVDNQPEDQDTGPEVDEEWLAQFPTQPIPDNLREPAPDLAGVT